MIEEFLRSQTSHFERCQIAEPRKTSPRQRSPSKHIVHIPTFCIWQSPTTNWSFSITCHKIHPELPVGLGAEATSMTVSLGVGLAVLRAPRLPTASGSRNATGLAHCTETAPFPHLPEQRAELRGGICVISPAWAPLALFLRKYL